jgi:DNA-binding response OmpR family regulator
MRTVLCVEKDDVALEELSNKIRDAGYRCLAASGEDEAERLFVANEVDVVILNNGAQERSGESLATHLTKIRWVRVLMLTKDLELLSLPKSVDFLLSQPCLPEALLDAVASLTTPVESNKHRANRAG